jgi:hypothetical protein
MKTLTISALALIMTSAWSLQSGNLEDGYRPVPIDHVYAPSGFDTNDASEIIVEGYLPNLCYQSPKSTYKINGKKIEILVTSLYKDNDQACPKAMVPFIEVVKVGELDKGLYDINVNRGGSDDKKTQLKVSESQSGAMDDYIYANVEYVEKNFGSETVVLKGYNPSDCFVFETIETVSNNKDTLSVLPKMKQVSDFCPLKMVPFEYEFKVPQSINKGRILLHVRGMDGRSVNTLYDQPVQK